MISVVALLVLLLPLALVLAVVAGAERVLGRAEPVAIDARYPGLVGAWGITDRSRTVGIALALVALAACFSAGNRWHGMTMALYPLAAATVVVSVVWAGQRLIGRRVAGSAASFETRRVVDYVPRRLTALAGATGVLLVAALATAVVVSAPDGRSIESTCLRPGPDGGAPVSYQGGGSFVGTYYAVPLAFGALLLLTLAALALRAVVARPRNGTEPGIVVADDEVRRRAATLVVAATGGGLGLTLTGLLAFDWSVVTQARYAATQPHMCGPAVGPGAEWVVGLLALGALVASLVFVARLIVPSSRPARTVVAEPVAV